MALGVLLNLSEPQYLFLFQRVDSLSALAGCCISIEKPWKLESSEKCLTPAPVGFPGALVVKNLPAGAGDVRDMGLILGWEGPLEEGMATHSGILAWRLPRTEEPGRLLFMGLQESDMT